MIPAILGTLSVLSITFVLETMRVQGYEREIFIVYMVTLAILLIAFCIYIIKIIKERKQ